MAGAPGRRYNRRRLEDNDWHSNHRVKLQSNNRKNRTMKTPKKVKKETKANRECAVKTRSCPIIFSDLQPDLVGKECEDDRDFANEVSTKNVVEVKNKNKTKNKKKIANEMTLKKESVEGEQSANKSNIGADESFSHQRRSFNAISIDIQLPAGTCPEYHLQSQEQDGCKPPQRSSVCGRTQESIKAQESPSRLNCHLTILCDTDTAADDDDIAYGGGTDAVNSQRKNPSGVASTSTAGHVGTGHIIVRPTIQFTSAKPYQGSHIGVNNAPNTELSLSPSSKINHKRIIIDSSSAVPICNHSEDPELATSPVHKDLRHRTDKYQTSPDSFGSVSLSDIYRVLGELSTKLEQYMDANLQSQPHKKHMSDDAIEQRIEQLERMVTSCTGSSADAPRTSKIDRVDSNHTNCRGKEPAVLTYRETPDSNSKQSNIEQHRTSPVAADSSPDRSVPLDYQRGLVTERAKNADLQELVRQLTLKTSAAEERMNRLEYDLVTTLGTAGKHQFANDPDQHQRDMVLPTAVGNQERTRSQHIDIQNKRASAAGKLIETETGSFNLPTVECRHT